MNIRKTLAWLMMIGTSFAAFALTACNTVEGVGRDVESLGDSIEDAADDADD
jgi:predicted small secreted protein